MKKKEREILYDNSSLYIYIYTIKWLTKLGIHTNIFPFTSFEMSKSP